MIDYQKDIDYINLKHDFDSYYTQNLLPILRSHEKVRMRYFLSFLALLFMAMIYYPYILKRLLSGWVDNSDYTVGISLFMFSDDDFNRADIYLQEKSKTADNA